eukprot:TRINITY_DN28973_c0_g2_i1.p2 TRINITY_DN28973_c0_g2~~TRINITY_DN28973_c0_g2_i1.p2  ORF type:complete len:293 (+),score=98.02 TRINITY_DN28973_c0_g2_i1:71-949(+)
MAEAAGLKRRGADAAGTAKLGRSSGKGAGGTPAQAAAAAAASGGSTAASSGAAKKERGGTTKQTDPEVVSLVCSVARLSLTSSREIATIKSAILAVNIFQRETLPMGPLADKVKAVTEDYHEAAKRAAPNEKQAMGSPHVYAWLEAVGFLTQTLKDIQNKTEMEKRLEQLLQQQDTKLMQVADEAVKAKPNVTEPAEQNKIKQEAIREAVASYCRVFRVMKCWNPKMARLEMHITGPEGSEMCGLLMGFMDKYAAGMTKVGQAPRSDTERRISKALDKMTKGGRAGQADMED